MDINCVFSQKSFNLEVKQIIIEIQKDFRVDKNLCVNTSRSAVSIDSRKMSAENILILLRAFQKVDLSR